MKKVKLFSFALATLMLGACTSEDVIDTGGKPQWNSQGKGYINLAIQLPTQPSTRANDKFDDGTPAEYDVKNATLLLFTGETDKGGTIEDTELTFNSAYNMNLNFYTEGTTDQITTTTKITQEINEIAPSDPDKEVVIKALVVLNNNGLFTVNNTTNKLLIDDKEFSGKLIELNTALKDKFNNISIKNTNEDGPGLLMANAVMANKQGGLATTAPSDAKLVGPLVNIDRDKIKKTKAEAEAEPAASIYVERAAAKVTVMANDGKLTAGETEENKLSYEIVGWALDNTNTTSKLVRTGGEGFNNWKTFTSSKLAQNNYRMIGGTPIATDLYRTYWDEDYNYNTPQSATSTGLSTLGGPHNTITSVISADGTTPGYCYENTTDLSSMTERNLTRVILKVQFNDGNAFYTVDDERDTLWAENDVKAEVAYRLLTQGPNTLYDWVKKNVKPDAVFNSKDLTIKLSDETAGKRTVTGVALSDTGKDKLKSTTAITDFETNIANQAVTIANTLIDLYYYADGIAYYPIYIKHFGDDLTPWTTPNTNGQTYDSDTNFLGRYGVLRNNWYDIQVKSIKGLGEPNVTEVTNDPVDKVNYYISVDINVLSWAKRTQEVEL